MQVRLVLLLVAALALPAASAAVQGFQADAGLPAGERHSWPIDGSSGDGLIVSWDSTTAVDVLVVRVDTSSSLDNSSDISATPGRFLNTTTGQGHITLPSDGPWLLLVDNTAHPAGGAAGDQPATVHVAVAPSLLEVPAGGGAPQTAGGSENEAPTLWNTLLFDAPHWAPGGIVGLGSIALWMILLAIAATYRIATPPRTFAMLVVLVAGVTIIWSLLPHPGILTRVGLPLLWGVGAGYLAVRPSATLPDATRFAVVATVLGTFAGVIITYGLRNLWSPQPMLVLGADRFEDVLFTLPMGALLGVGLFRLVPDIVHAFEDASADDVVPVEQAPGQHERFTVVCLRCKTEITVDRSMKRFRVATDRFEFACPNCQYWMEWADPAHRNGAAAA